MKKEQCLSSDTSIPDPLNFFVKKFKETIPENKR